MDAKPIKKHVAHLMSIKQDVNEPLSDYTKRLNEKTLTVDDYTEQFTIHTCLKGYAYVVLSRI